METRGTRASETPTYDYRMSHIVKDVYDMLMVLKKRESIFYGSFNGRKYYFGNLLGQIMIKKFILCAQSPWLWSDPNEIDDMILHGGHPGHLYELKKGL